MLTGATFAISPSRSCERRFHADHSKCVMTFHPVRTHDGRRELSPSSASPRLHPGKKSRVRRGDGRDLDGLSDSRSGSRGVLLSPTTPSEGSLTLGRGSTEVISAHKKARPESANYGCPTGGLASTLGFNNKRR